MDSIGKSAWRGRIGSAIAALSVAEMSGTVHAICDILNQHGFSISQGEESDWAFLVIKILAIYVVLTSVGSKMRSENRKETENA